MSCWSGIDDVMMSKCVNMKKANLILFIVLLVISCENQKTKDDEMNQLINEVHQGIDKNKEVMLDNKFEFTVIDTSDLKFKKDTNYLKLNNDYEIYDVVNNSKDKSISK